jgi:hypothetical protein
VINLANERTYALSHARRWFPRRRRGKRPSLQTMYRWSNEGYHGVVLETVQVGSTRCTTHEACNRFIEQVSRTTLGRAADPTAGLRSQKQVERSLRETGFDRQPVRSLSTSRRDAEVPKNETPPRHVYATSPLPRLPLIQQEEGGDQ